MKMGKRAIGCLVGALLCAAPAMSFAQESDFPAAFEPVELRNLYLEMDPEYWEIIRFDNTYDIEMPAYFWTDGEVPMLVSVRRKSGDAEPSESDPQKVSLKIDVNEYTVGQKWHGLTKLSLENGDDQDVVREGLGWQLHRMASGVEGYGYDAGFANWAKVFVNGDYKGVYVNVEQRNKQFLRNHGLYVNGETWLYKISDVGKNTLKVGTGDSPTVQALCYLPFNGGSVGKGKKKRTTDTGCPVPDDATLAAELSSLIDMQGMLTLGAVNAFLVDPDLLFSKGKNVYFVDFLGGYPRMYFPWDLDSIMSNSAENIYGRNKAKGKKTTIEQTDYQKIILNHPVFRAQFNQIMTDLLDGPLSEANIHAMIDQVELTLTAALEQDPNNRINGSIAGHFESSRQWISERIASVRQQVAANNSPPPRG